jgi:transcriptional regulator with XRE-family HTH domain
MMNEQEETSLELGRTELQAQFVELRAKGWSYAKIARKLKVSKGTLSNWSQELEGEIATLKAIELESLYERYYMTKEGRIKLLGKQLKDIEAELKKRGLEDISTEKLVDLKLKVYEALLDEYTEVKPLTFAEIEALQA